MATDDDYEISPTQLYDRKHRAEAVDSALHRFTDPNEYLEGPADESPMCPECGVDLMWITDNDGFRVLVCEDPTCINA